MRAAVDARMSELRLSTAELARGTRMSETTMRALRKGRSRSCGLTITSLNEDLGLPGATCRDRRGTSARPALITAGARLAHLEQRVDHLISLVRNDPVGL